ncbi:hypothetical protein OO007_00220 [Cocleimonas sp. KMM 6892]|uniref:hypothetical protein n=1 Tax=unclassified Cocleimonas TaxID=2639732 RepID=UPI002DB88B94|nr:MULTISPECIES: hypothetical protein [unclassified Cocleimonas]MEB8430637.1 hypothetical protein [Cocleimonas sp. KMM 6892]MEC4716912.1 hypothetical protein [Cocleimonas sp. KMM 6895]MEC4743924.1 hypothetical protein [Cocleimonas sp. KMM 6896]
MKLTSIITFMALFLSLFMPLFIPQVLAGVAHAAPTKIEDRSEYSTSLNTIAAVIMNWYGSLITDNQAEDRQSSFNTKNTGDQWSDYRSQYPKNISQILITSTDLLKLENDNGYQFNVKSKIIHSVKNQLQTQLLDETFVFKNDFLLKENQPLIKTISRNKSETIQSTDTETVDTKKANTYQYNRSHYKVREFTYAWLAYIDGVKILKPTMNASAWLDKATYSLNMGSDHSEDSIPSILEKRRQLLAKGGHLLRSLDIKNQDNESNTFVIDLILEWKGTSPKGKPVIARIHQEIKVHIKTDQSWEVISITEEHLLPVTAPWMGLVC